MVVFRSLVNWTGFIFYCYLLNNPNKPCKFDYWKYKLSFHKSDLTDAIHFYIPTYRILIVFYEFINKKFKTIFLNKSLVFHLMFVVIYVAILKYVNHRIHKSWYDIHNWMISKKQIYKNKIWQNNSVQWITNFVAVY